MTEYEEQIRKRVLVRLDLTREIQDEDIYELIDEEIRDSEHTLSLNVRLNARKNVFDSLRGFDVLQALIDDNDVTEIMVNSSKNIFYEKKGNLYRWEGGFASPDKLEDTIQSIVASGNRIVNEASPIVDTRLLTGARVNIVLAPVAIDGSAITIRKFPKRAIRIDDLLSLGSISQEIADFLKLMVECGSNIFISGGTGSGKTTFLNALSGYIPKTERVITIEDSAELQIEGVDNLVRLETRQSNLDNVAAISIRDLIKTALRMRPDRIIVGECRGAETLDMLQAMNTGHDGSLSTGHANSCKDMLSRLETMVLMGMELPLAAIRGQIASGIDLMIHLSRFRDKTRKLADIVEVIGMRENEVELNVLYQFEETGTIGDRIQGDWIRKGQIRNTGKLAAAGLLGKYEELMNGL